MAQQNKAVVVPLPTLVLTVPPMALPGPVPASPATAMRVIVALAGGGNRTAGEVRGWRTAAHDHETNHRGRAHRGG